MREGWTKERLGDISTIAYGYTEKASFETVGPKFLRITDIQNGQVDWPSVPSCPISDADFKRHQLQHNDIVFARTGATTGKSYRVDSPLNAVAASYLIRLRLHDQNVLPSFVSLFFQTPEYWDTVNSGTSGSAQGGFNASKLSNLFLPKPPLTEQKRIVAILDEAFEEIDKAIANAERNLNNAKELFESYLNNIFTQKGEGWLERKLGDAELIQIIDGDRGANYPKKSDFLDVGFCLFLNTKNVRPDGFNFDKTMFITEEKDEALRKGKLKRCDVLLTTRGTIGNIALYDDGVDFDEIRINSGMLIFRPNEKTIKSEYLFEILRSGIVKSQIKRFVSGTAQPQLPIKTLVKFTIPVPASLGEQMEIVSRLRNLSNETKHLEAIYQQKLDSLAQLKRSILQKAFSGEMTADDAQLKEEAVA